MKKKLFFVLLGVIVCFLLFVFCSRVSCPFMDRFLAPSPSAGERGP